MNSAKKDEDGKVITGPRNFTTKPVKKGKIDSVYIMKPTYLNPETNDPQQSTRVNFIWKTLNSKLGNEVFYWTSSI